MTDDLSDTISLYYKQIDVVHRVWAYLQFIGLGLAAFVWSGETPKRPDLLFVALVAFLIFAGVNLWSLVSRQREVLGSFSAIQDRKCSSQAHTETTLARALASLQNPASVCTVVTWYLVLCLVPVGSIVIRLLTVN